MSVRVYEPPEDESSTPIETEAGAGGARRQVMRAPQIEVEVAALRAELTTRINALQASNTADSDSEEAAVVALRAELTTRINALQASNTADSTAERALLTAVRDRLSTPASPVPARIGDGTNQLTLLTGTPLGTEVALPVRNIMPIQNVRQSFESATRLGNAFSSSSGVLSAPGGLTATTMRGLLMNPAGSGLRMYIASLAVWSSSATTTASLLINPTTNLPATVRPKNNVFIGHPTTTPAVPYFDIGTAMSGGSDSGIRIPIQSGRPERLELPPFILSPGLSMGINAVFSAATDVVFTLYWWQEAL